MSVLAVNFSMIALEYMLGVTLVLSVTKFLGKRGLYMLSAVLVVYMNIAVVKLFDFIPGVIQMGGSTFLSTFYVTIIAIFAEVEGRKQAGKLLLSSFLGMVTFLTGILVAIGYIPAAEDWAQEHMVALFMPVWRVTLFSWVAFLTSGYFKAWFQIFLKKVPFLEKRLWIRDNLSTKLAQLLDNAIFLFGSFVGMRSLGVIWKVFLATTLVECCSDYLDTWVVVKAVKMLKRKGENGQKIQADA